MKKILALALILALLSSALTSCALAEEKLVMTSFYPIYLIARNVLHDVEGVRLQNLTAPTTGCLHDYQLLAGDVRALAEADALVINGAGMEHYLDALTAQLPALPLVDCSLDIALLPDEEDGGMNAHIWLDPQNAAKMTENMAAGLAEILPEHAAQIHQNAAAYAETLRALDAEIRESLKDLASRDIVTFHEAFPYFAQAYDLNVVAVVAVEADEALSPRELSLVADKILAAGCPPLFTEPQYAADAAVILHNETGAPVFELDPLVTGDGALSAYEDGMRKNAETLKPALGAGTVGE